MYTWVQSWEGIPNDIMGSSNRSSLNVMLRTRISATPASIVSPPTNA